MVTTVWDGVVTAYPAYRLWLGQGGLTRFMPVAAGPAIGLGSRRLAPIRRTPTITVERMVGIARGQARLDTLIWRGAPFG